MSNESGETVSVIDTSTRTVVSTIPIGGAGTSLAISPDGTKGYVTLGYGTISQRVRVLDLVTNTAGLMIDFTGVAVGSAVFSKDGSYVFMGGINTGLIYVIDTLTDIVVDTEPAPPGGPSGISVSADGSRFYVITNNSWLAQYDAFTYEQIGSPVALGTVAARTIGSFLSPPMLTSGTLPITTDADLDAPGFGTYVNFSGGTLQINGSWSTSRVISVLAGGGTIDTNGWPLTLPSTINDGVLTKSGTGLLTITTPGHTGGTTITAGGLLLGGGTTHSAPITVQGGALHGSGTAGSITVSGGAIQPGTPGVGNTAILQATNVTFSPAARSWWTSRAPRQAAATISSPSAECRRWARAWRR